MEDIEMFLYVAYKVKKSDILNCKHGANYVDGRLFPFRDKAISFYGVYQLRRYAIKDVIQLNMNNNDYGTEYVVSGDQFDTRTAIVKNGKIIDKKQHIRPIDIPSDAEKLHLAKINGRYYEIKKSSVFEKEDDEHSNT